MEERGYWSRERRATHAALQRTQSMGAGKIILELTAVSDIYMHEDL